MQMFKTLLPLAALCSWMVSTADGALISAFTFTGPSSTASTSVVEVTTSAFADGDGTVDFSTTIGNPAPSVFKSYTDLPDGAFNSTAWLGFSVSPNAGYELDLTSLEFDVRRDQVSGMNASNAQVTIEVRASLDGFSTDSTIGSYVLTANGGNFTADLSYVLTTQDLVLPQTLGLRLYLRDGGRTGTDIGFYLDNVELYGTVAAIVVVPEPTSLALCGLGALGMAFGAARRRRQKAAAV